MFLILKRVDKENSKYPANVDYPDLPKQKKKFPNIAGALSVYTESIIWISRSFFEKKIFEHRNISFINGSIQIFTKKESSILVPSCTNFIHAIS